MTVRTPKPYRELDVSSVGYGEVVSTEAEIRCVGADWSTSAVAPRVNHRLPRWAGC